MTGDNSERGEKYRFLSKNPTRIIDTTTEIGGEYSENTCFICLLGVVCSFAAFHSFTRFFNLFFLFFSNYFFLFFLFHSFTRWFVTSLGRREGGLARKTPAMTASTTKTTITTTSMPKKKNRVKIIQNGPKSGKDNPNKSKTIQKTSEDNPKTI